MNLKNLVFKESYFQKLNNSIKIVVKIAALEDKINNTEPKTAK